MIAFDLSGPSAGSVDEPEEIDNVIEVLKEIIEDLEAGAALDEMHCRTYVGPAGEDVATVMVTKDA